MKASEFIKDKLPSALLQATTIFCFILFLRLTGYSMTNCIIIFICWGLMTLIRSFACFAIRKRYFAKMTSIMENLDQRYLLGELMPKSFRLEDELYRKMIQKSNQSVIEKIHSLENTQKEYREYIESWVHEIKAPITAITLHLENHKNESSRFLSEQSQKIENYIDMVLFYARSNEVYKDYLIAETNLQEVTEEILMKNKQSFINCGIRAEVLCPDKVFTDRKWIGFILNQLILNSVKYRRKEKPFIQIITAHTENEVTLTVKDNGIGIKKEELPRIFEKGFTGTNGRKAEHSTGMGLYLCQKLCGKLGITISAKSEAGNGTEILLRFPRSTFFSDYRAS